MAAVRGAAALLTCLVIILSSTVHTNGEQEAETVSETTTEAQEVEISTEMPLKSLGVFRLTAYCSCEKCCEQWAKNRPNGKVLTASGAEAKAGVTIAADTKVLPFGTVVIINGHEYTVQDRGGAIKGNRIDIYFNSHKEAMNFGVQHSEVFRKGGEIVK